MTSTQPNYSLQFIVIDSPNSMTAAEELSAGLMQERAMISPKFFYDRLGSALFDAIVQLSEYYPPQAEAEILDTVQSELLGRVGKGLVVCDLGAGDCQKAERWLAMLHPSHYVAMDISADHLRQSMLRLREQFPALPMTGIGLDFSMGIPKDLPLPAQPRLFLYPGSSIGNFSPLAAANLLSDIRHQLHGGWLLLGVDLVKPKAVLELAYDDPLKVTAAFNLNILRHVNQRLKSNFQVEEFEHHAFFNPTESRIEMHLRAKETCTVSWPGGSRVFQQGESIHTENSYKYTPESLQALLGHAGFSDQQIWTDRRGYFAVVLAR